MASQRQPFSNLYRGYAFTISFLEQPGGVAIEIDIDVDRYPTRPGDQLYADYESASKQGVKQAHRLIDQLIGSWLVPQA